MRLATAAESRRLDELTQTKYGVSGEALMEAAGALAAREIRQSFLPELSAGGVVCVVCGPGNNGGDGLVIARHLAADGQRVRVLAVVPDADKRSPLYRVQFDRCLRAGLDCVEVGEAAMALAALQEVPSAIFVDAIFGTGLRGRVQTPFAEVIEALNSERRTVVSIDTPSGLDADRGIALAGGACVRAKMTITIGLVKPGFLVSDGPSFTGRLRLLTIGFPEGARIESARSTFAFGERLALKSLPRRQPASNKSRHGHALIIAGSPGMYGAGVLAATAAYRVGSGYVTLASHEEPREITGSHPEILTGVAMDERFWRAPKWSAVAIGPGLGSGGGMTHELLKRLIARPGARVVVDADALFIAQANDLWPLPKDWILTPHAGELARILGVQASAIEDDRLHFAREAAKFTGCHVLLKGFRTVLASNIEGQARATVVLSGNAALAKAGTGDVLTGMIAGLLAQGLPPRRAALTGAYLHGLVADEWLRSGRSQSSLVASDVCEVLPALLKRLEVREVSQ